MIYNGKSALILVGAGKMGGALLAGWLGQGIDPGRINVVEPNADQAKMLKNRYGVSVASSVQALSLDAAPDAVILAVKPQAMEAALKDYRPFVAEGTAFISIAAGKTLDFFLRHLGEEAAIIRAMPNLPSTVQQGATVLCASSAVTDTQRQLASFLFDAVGLAGWVEEEALLDAATALSGSGPAYVFLLAEAMLEAGIALGLPPQLANRFARQTLQGSATMLAQAEESPHVLREHVTSPGGTTEAALRVLMREGGVRSLILEAMQAAATRSRELAE